jgi:cellulose synthase operon protein YhjU
MGAWAFYFLPKIVLYFWGHIPFDVVANVVFALWVLVPTPVAWSRSRAVVWTRRAATGVVAVLLAWHDSWLPPLPGAVEFLVQTGLPSEDFLAQFALQSLATREVAWLAAVIAGALLIRRYMRLTPVVLVLLVVVAVRVYAKTPSGNDAVLASFYAHRAEDRVAFVGRREGQPAFDVLILHLCSLSWDDLAAIGRAKDPFFDQFDILFTRFNSVTTYSIPSVIRLLRAPCGQTPHDALYRPAGRGCYLMDALLGDGFEPSYTLSHDGTYAGWREQVERFGRPGVEVRPEGVPIRLVDYEGAPVYEDYGMLAGWFVTRQSHKAPRVALYYNTGTLHDGNRWAGDGNWWSRDRSVQYGEFADALFSDLDRFFAVVESSGRDAVVVVVAEHGMALRGSALQPAGLREVPLPQITTVPVGVKFIGPSWFRGARPVRQVVDRPTSYLAIATLLAELSARPTIELGESALRRLVEGVPATEFVAETEGAIVMDIGTQYVANRRSLNRQWVALPLGVIPAGVAPQAKGL